MMCSPSILLLFFSSRPAAVGRRVAFVIINPFYSKVWRGSVAHIGNEVGELQPSFTDINAPATVVFVRWIIEVGAALKHCIPDKVFGRSVFAMLERSQAYRFGLEAPTRASVFVQKDCKIKRSFFSAITATKPAASTSPDAFENDEHAKPLTCNIDVFAHGGSIVQIQRTIYAYPKVGRPSMTYYLDPLPVLS